MSFNYKNPLTPLTLLGNLSVQRNDIFGTNFSVLSTGGYMEVYSLNDLSYTIPPTTGLIKYSGNTIPIQLNKGNGSPFSFDVLTLNSDNISSGRRRIGMMVYVINQNQIYQYQIPNFETLFNSATGATGIGGATVVFSDFGTTVKSNSPEGISFISSWTANTIEGVSGETSTTAVWKKFVTGGGVSGDYLPLSGGTVTGNTIFTSGLTATTISATTYQNLPIDPDTYTTGFTYGNNVFTIKQNNGQPNLTATINSVTGWTVNGNLTVTGNTSVHGLTATTISATTYQNLPNLIGDYLPLSGGTVTGNTVFTSGLTATTISATTYQNLPNVTGDYLPLSGGTVTGDTIFTSGLTANTISATTYQNLPIDPDTYTTGFTYNTNVFTIKQNNGQPDLTATINSVTGWTVNGDLTVTGNTSVQGLTATTISATTYQNLPVDPDSYVTGFTLNSDIITLSQNRNDQYSAFTISLSAYTGNTGVSGDYLPLSGGTVTGDTIFTSGLTATTISATTYQNLPIDPDTFVTGFTYGNNIFIIKQNNGQPDLTATINSVTGWTVNGDLTITGNTSVQGLTATTISATTYQNLPNFMGDYLPLSGGTVTGDTIFTSGLTANTISATTYQNLPIDPDTFVTGFTYNTNVFTIKQNNGQPDLTATINSVTGWTVNGDLTITGNTSAQGLTATTISATTYQNLPTDVFVTGGTYTSGNAIFTNNTGGTFTVSGFTVGGGGGQIFYLNLSQSQNGNRLLSTTGSTASEQSTGVTINNGVTSTIASFQSQPLNTTLLPGGIWSFYLHSYKQNTNASFNIFVELYKITSGGTQTLLFTTDPAPVTTNSPNPSMQLSDGYFSGTPLSVSDSIVAVVRATNTGNQSHIITLVTEGSQHYSYAVSTIPTQQGLTCDTLSGCSIIQTIQTDISNKFDKSGGTVTGDTIFTSGLTATTISGGTYVGDGSQLSIANSSTGTTITFTAGTIYNSPTSAATGNISADTTNSKIGIVQKIYHNDSVSPTFNPSGWVKLGIGSYTTSTLNIIYAEWVSGSRIEYWITQ
jgi:enamine deaminase RidA (YjgF/YER057c/UK114 family)